MEKELVNVAKKSSLERYCPLPEGYEKGTTKYLIVTGSVISGIGKGTLTSCLCKLFANRGMNVEPMKIEAYLNVDAGTLNPYRHGEVFVLADGTETDMDLGSYERFLDKDLSGENFLTSGKIYRTIIEKERKGLYLGRDVQFIPHVTGETKYFVRELAVRKKPDIVIVEIGGTVGDYENLFAIEAMRELKYEEGSNNVCILNMTYIIEPPHLGEHKTKAAQLGLRRLQELGITPDVVVCRSHTPISKRIKEKISVNANIPLENIFNVPDFGTIYRLPRILHLQGLDEKILQHFGIAEKFRPNTEKLLEWENTVLPKENAKDVKIAIAGKYIGVKDAYVSIINALEHCEAPLNVHIKLGWIDVQAIEEGKLSVEECSKYAGIIVPGGFGARGVEGKIKVAEYCRKHNIPYLGLCLGFQIAVIEFARNVCMLEDANSTEFEPSCRNPVIDLLPEQKRVDSFGATMRLGAKEVYLKPGTRTFEIHGRANKIVRRFRHRYEFNIEYKELFESKGLVFSGHDESGRIMQILELPTHKFYFATQYHAEFTSRPLKPDPFFLNFVKAAASD